MKLDSLTKQAVSATLHCLTGCAIGEILGLIIGTTMSLNNTQTIILAVLLAFGFGYAFTTWPLIKSGLTIKAALGIALIADTFSIATMEIVDNFVMAMIPGAMGAGLANPLFWLSLPLSLLAAFIAAVPVNRYLINKGLGHALAHRHHHHEK